MGYTQNNVPRVPTYPEQINGPHAIKGLGELYQRLYFAQNRMFFFEISIEQSVAFCNKRKIRIYAGLEQGFVIMWSRVHIGC